MTIITLLTDFGTSDGYVAEMRGVLLTRAAGVTLCDITHAIAPGDIRSAAYVLGRTAQRFPHGTVHLVVVDPGVGSDRRALAVEAAGSFFVGPDNGVLSSALQAAHAQAVTLPAAEHASPTFHGRDLFAPAAARIAQAAALTAAGGAPAEDPVLLPIPVPHHEGKSLLGEVVYVDRFGTLVTNFTVANLPEWARIEVEGVDVGKLRQTFSDVDRGGLVAYLGSGGEVEIAVRDGSAARRLGIGVGGRVRARLG